jgi:hypothetical protein
MAHWNSSPHPISDIRDWQESGRLELAADFQRREVWSTTARIMLIDTILRDIPMPKVFVASSIRDGRTYRIVIDGQQRLRTLFAFLKDEFSLDSPAIGANERGKTFSALDSTIRDNILSYIIDFNEAVNPTDKEIREVYSRVNKYTVALNKQELRRADYPGDFLKLAESLANDDSLDSLKVFTPADRRRLGDVEYVSELLAAMLGGIQDGKSSLDTFYQEYSTWDKDHLARTTAEFHAVLKELRFLFESPAKFAESRFRQKADFYTLFVTLLAYVREDLSLEGKLLGPLEDDLFSLDHNIRPESHVTLCREYAIKCVSQANSASSRRWRADFMTAIFNGTYRALFPVGLSAEVYYSIEEDLATDPAGMCPDPVIYCPVCHEEIKSVHDALLAWEENSVVFQMSNSSWIGRECLNDLTNWKVLDRPVAK